MKIQTLNYMKKVVNYDFVMPTDIEIHPTNLCNQDCLWCIMSEERKNNAHMNQWQLQTLGENIVKNKDIKNIFICGGGDPLVNQNLFKDYQLKDAKYSSFFEMLYMNGVGIGLSTNGEYLDKLIESKAYMFIDSLRVSVDAGCDETYQILHRSKKNRSLEQIIRSIENYYLASQKKVALSFLIHDFNLEQYVTLANRFVVPDAVSKIEAKNLMNEIPIIKYGMEEIVVNGIKICFPQHEVYPVHDYSYITSLIIDASGDVYPCCHHLVQKYFLGNIFETDLLSIVKSKYEFLKHINCERCSKLEINKLISEFKVIGGDKYENI